MMRLCRIWHFLLLAAAILIGNLPLRSQALIPKESRHGMVVSTQALASEAGLEILRRGGNAIDAAITTAFVLAVVYPSCGNIGGEGFLLIMGATVRVRPSIFVCRPRPRSLPKCFLMNQGKIGENHPSKDCISPIVPWPLAFLELWPVLPWPHRRFGTLPWVQLLEPAIRLAEQGFPVSASLHKEMVDSLEFIKKYPSSVCFFSRRMGRSMNPVRFGSNPILPRP